jgi:hypothetical protein
MRARRTVRTWNNSVVGLVGPHDVQELQSKVKAYHELLLVAVDDVVRQGKTFPADGSTFSKQAWDDLSEREAQFVAESSAAWNPMAYLYSGSSYERGRKLIVELDAWRDHLASLVQTLPEATRAKVTVPDPVAVPHSDLGIAGGLGFALAGLIAILALREFGK